MTKLIVGLLIAVSTASSAWASSKMSSYDSASLFETLSTLQSEGKIEAKLNSKIINGEQVETISTARISCTHTQMPPDEDGLSDDYTCIKL